MGMLCGVVIMCVDIDNHRSTILVVLIKCTAIINIYNFPCLHEIHE